MTQVSIDVQFFTKISLSMSPREISVGCNFFLQKLNLASCVDCLSKLDFTNNNLNCKSLQTYIKFYDWQIEADMKEINSFNLKTFYFKLTIF